MIIEPAPKRLLEEDGALGELLQGAQRGFDQGLDPQRAWLRSRQEKPGKLGLGWLLAPCAVALAAAVFWLGPWRAPGDLQVTAEAPRLQSPALPASQTPPNLPDVTPIPSSRPPRSAPATALSDARRTAPQPSVSAKANDGATPETTEREECLTFARNGDPRRAATCFQERASGAGLSAQVALYELSRLQRDALGEPAAALDSLTQYLQRFPNGSLNGEVRFSRLELLARLGRSSEALSASHDFLSSPFGAERAAEVHLFRGNLFLRGAGSASQAVAEYRAALGTPGRVGDDAAYQLAVALEASGSKSEAIDAYQQYLARSAGRHRSAASSRLAELSQ